MKDTILTYTRNDLQEIKTSGCDKSWVLNKDRAAACKYLVCCHSEGAKRGNAFLVALISRISYVGVDQDSGKNRWAIDISEYANIDIPNVWGGWQNPVHYTSLEELRIDPSTIKFEKLQEGEKKTGEKDIPPLTLEQAKHGLAKYFDVKKEQIEILIKG